MASPRSTATFATANSQFEVEDTSIQNISIATIPEAELPKDHKDLICDISNDTREQQVEQRWGLLPEVTPTQTIITTHEELIPEVDTLRKDIDWNTTGTIKQETPRTYEQITKSRAKEQYYREAFAGREAPNFSRQRLIKTSVLIAEIKTNIVVSSAEGDDHNLSY